MITNANLLETEAVAILEDIMRAATVESCKITSARRTPEDQARVMYENCIAKGADFSYRLYGAAGDEVIAVYEAMSKRPRAEVIAAMRDKILEIGSERVSRHCSDKYHVFDVAPSSIPISKHRLFTAAVRGHKSTLRLIEPPTDPAFHIELKKSA